MPVFLPVFFTSFFTSFLPFFYPFSENHEFFNAESPDFIGLSQNWLNADNML
jgi:hypothetical protein